MSPVPLLGASLNQAEAEQGRKHLSWREQLGLEYWGTGVLGWMNDRGSPGPADGPWLCFLAVAIVASTQAA